MPKEMTKAERAAYQRDYRNRKKRELAAAANIELSDKTSDKTPVDMSTAGSDRTLPFAEEGITTHPAPVKPPWKVIPNPVSPLRNVHAECEKAERRSWQREQDARADYAAMLGLLRVIATAKEQAPGSRRYLVYEDTMTAILAITDAVHERERQAAEFAIDPNEPF